MGDGGGQERAETGSVADVDWGAVFAEALDLATEVWSARVAEEIVSTGVERVFAGDAPWDPAGKNTLAKHVVAVGFNVRRNERRAAQRRRRSDFVAGAAQALEERGTARPDDAAEEKDERAFLFARLRQRCEGFPDALAILDAEKQGVMGQKAQIDSLQDERARLDDCAKAHRADAQGRRGRSRRAMTDEDKRKAEGAGEGDAGEAWDRAVDGQLDFEAERVAGKTPGEVDASLAAKGIDAAAARARGQALVAKLRASTPAGPAASGTRPALVPASAPVREPHAPERRSRGNVVWIGVGVLAAAAVVVLVVRGLGTGGPNVAAQRDDAATPLPELPAAPTRLQVAADARREAFALCKAERWDACSAKLDDAARLDPDGDRDPRVVAARAQAKKGMDEERERERESEKQRLK